MGLKEKYGCLLNSRISFYKICLYVLLVADEPSDYYINVYSVYLIDNTG